MTLRVKDDKGVTTIKSAQVTVTRRCSSFGQPELGLLRRSCPCRSGAVAGTQIGFGLSWKLAPPGQAN